MTLGAGSAAGSAQTMNGGINVTRTKEQIIELTAVWVKAEKKFQGFFTKLVVGIASDINWVLNNDSDNSTNDSNTASEATSKSSDRPHAPDEPLRREDGTPKVDKEAEGKGKEHTQLGTKNGRKGEYTQGREFDKDGKPVKDIDHTDHGRPQNHPNPHQHDYNPNPSGGTMQRSKEAKPLIY